MEFYSHYYSQDPSDYINKKDINIFKIKIDRTNPKKYIMDVNTVDRYMLK